MSNKCETPPTYLVLANWSLGCSGLGNRLLELSKNDASATFHLLVPVTQSPDGWLASDDRCVEHAHERLELMVGLGRQLGMSIDGEVYGSDADTDPVAATRAVLAEGRYTHVVVSTLTTEPAQWMTCNVVGLLRASTDLPIEQVESAMPDHYFQSNFSRFAAWVSAHAPASDSD